MGDSTTHMMVVEIAEITIRDCAVQLCKLIV